MSFKNIINIIILVPIFFLSSCMSVENILLKKPEIIPIDKQLIESKMSIDLKKNIHSSFNHRDFFDEFNYYQWDIEKYSSLKVLKNRKVNYYEQNPLTKFISDNNFMILSNDGFFLIYNKENFEIKRKIDLNIHLNNDKSYPTSMASLNDKFYSSFSEGKIICFDLNGKIYWIKDFKDSLKTPIKILNEDLIVLLGNKIISLDPLTGNIKWEFYYENENYLDAKGGDIIELKHYIFFILPNGNIGYIDTVFAEKKISKILDFNSTKGINSSLSKLHSYKNFISLFENNRYLSTIDVTTNKFIFKNNEFLKIKSFKYINNSIITLDENFYLKSSNLINGRLFWKLNLTNLISKNDKIIEISNTNKSLIIFFNNGLVLNIDALTGEIIQSVQLKIDNIINIDVYNNLLIFEHYNGRTSIFSK